MKYSKLANFLTLILIFSAQNSLSKDLGSHGRVWEIKEKNIVSYIKSRLNSKDVQKITEDFKKKVEAEVVRPEAVNGISKTLKKEVHYFNPEIVLQKDVVDHTGRVMHKKGTRINPLDYQEFTRKLLFIDGDNKEHVNYALIQHKKFGEDLKIVLVDGSPIELMKTNKMVRFYFDQQGYLTKTFGIKTAPSLVQKEGKLIKIEGIVLEGSE
jgi:conjugal transfer pilus assembly protein TraW